VSETADWKQHRAGDRVLQSVAACFMAAVRGNDFVARIGGEEFVMLLSGTKIAPAMRRKQLSTGPTQPCTVRSTTAKTCAWPRRPRASSS
jgi:diguanylate cyclase (GGDEF)-like protein